MYYLQVNITDQIVIIAAHNVPPTQDREVLFGYVIEEYTNSRRGVLVKQFIDALTIGGPGGTPRPIEMHAHEPTR